MSSEVARVNEKGGGAGDSEGVKGRNQVNEFQKERYTKIYAKLSALVLVIVFCWMMLLMEKAWTTAWMLVFPLMIWNIKMIAFRNFMPPETMRKIGKPAFWCVMIGREIFWTCVLMVGVYKVCQTAVWSFAWLILLPELIWFVDAIMFKQGGFVKFVRPLFLSFVCAIGLWFLREWTRPDFYKCEACGKEYTCVNGDRTKPNGYCEKVMSHKHSGDVIERYGAFSEATNRIASTLKDTRPVKWLSTLEEKCTRVWIW